jgi:hypothetical protein
MSALFSASANKEKNQDDVGKKRQSKRWRKRLKGRKSRNLLVFDEAKTKRKFVQGDRFKLIQIIKSLSYTWYFLNWK